LPFSQANLHRSGYEIFDRVLFIFQLTIEAQKLLGGILHDQKASIKYHPDRSDPIPTIFDYIEQIRISLWDTTFIREFAVEKGMNKNNTMG